MSLAQEFTLLGHAAEAVAGAKSQFDVVVDGDVLFSKQHEGRFPELDELRDRL